MDSAAAAAAADAAKSGISSSVQSWLSSAFTDMFGDSDAWRATIIGNSPLLLLLLLRLNRVLVPILLRYFRSMRSRALSSVPLDVAAEMKDNPTQRLLPPTGTSQIYSTFVTDLLSKLHDPSTPKGEEEELYFQLRVLAEERNRVTRFAPLLFPDSIARYFTLVCLLLFTVLICLAVFSLYTFTIMNKISFTASVLFAGTTAESDTLFGRLEHMPHWVQHLAANYPAEGQGKDQQYIEQYIP